MRRIGREVGSDEDSFRDLMITVVNEEEFFAAAEKAGRRVEVEPLGVVEEVEEEDLVDLVERGDIGGGICVGGGGGAVDGGEEGELALFEGVGRLLSA